MPEMEIIPKYCDHDAICMTWKKIESNIELGIGKDKFNLNMKKEEKGRGNRQKFVGLLILQQEVLNMYLKRHKF